MKRLLAAFAILTVLAASPSPVRAGTTQERCERLVDRINVFRDRDLRLKALLCRVGAERARAMAAAGSIWHDLGPVRRALNAAGVCWQNVGEVVAWNNYSGSARAFVSQWKASPPHWDLLMARRYQRGGGSWANITSGHYAAFYVLDVCS